MEKAVEKTIEERVKAGREKLKDAIKRNDAVGLNVCVEQFKKLGKLSSVTDVLMECPNELILRAKPTIPIISRRFNRTIVIGSQVPWEFFLVEDRVQALKAIEENLGALSGSEFKIEMTK